jgi:hypothetical protein
MSDENEDFSSFASRRGWIANWSDKSFFITDMKTCFPDRYHHNKPSHTSVLRPINYMSVLRSLRTVRVTKKNKVALMMRYRYDE